MKARELKEMIEKSNFQDSLALIENNLKTGREIKIFATFCGLSSIGKLSEIKSRIANLSKSAVYMGSTLTTWDACSTLGIEMNVLQSLIDKLEIRLLDCGAGCSEISILDIEKIRKEIEKTD